MSNSARKKPKRTCERCHLTMDAGGGRFHPACRQLHIAEMAAKKPKRTCEVCGLPVPQGTGVRAPEMHPHCRDLKKFLAAAERAAELCAFDRHTLGTRSAFYRSQALKIANRLPVRFHTVRGVGGRFVPKEVHPS